MGSTLAEKILARCSDNPAARAGDIVIARVDSALLDDILGPRLLDKEMKRLQARVWDPEKVAVICDHYAPSSTVKQADIVKFTRDWAREYQIPGYFEGLGPCHQIMAESGYDIPGTLQVGVDSHTCTAGAFACFGTGIGSTEMLSVLCLGEIWLRVPASIRIQWEGELPAFVMAKDISLRSIKEIRHSGATYMAMEYCGGTIRMLPMDERMCLCNMAIEAGGKAGLIASDETTRSFLEGIGRAERYIALDSDTDAVYEQELFFDASQLEPMVACPHEVDNVFTVREMEGRRMHRIYIGSCTGGRLHDLAIASRILTGKKISENCKLLVSPASQNIWKQANALGYLQTLAEAGATILAPTCGACLGVHSGLLAGGENCASTTNRNFKGRMGSSEAGVYLVSPATAAASAIHGVLTDPRCMA